MQLTIPEDIEASLRKRAQMAGFENVEEYALSLLEEEASEPVDVIPFEQWHQKFYEFVNSLGPGNPDFDDSRESIYPDR